MNQNKMKLPDDVSAQTWEFDTKEISKGVSL